MMRYFLGKAVMLFGICLLFFGTALWSYNEWDSVRAGEAAEDTLSELTEIGSFESIPPDTSGEESVIREEMPVRETDGICYLGVLSIPALELELPVISSWSPENAKTAPCRYSGSVYSEDMILCAHNYRSHFGNLPSLNVGDAVAFTDMDGICHCYQVTELEVLDGTDLEQMGSGEWDLTLFTCTSGGKSRFTVRCKRTE